MCSITDSAPDVSLLAMLVAQSFALRPAKSEILMIICKKCFYHVYVLSLPAADGLYQKTKSMFFDINHLNKNLALQHRCWELKEITKTDFYPEN